MTNQSSYLHLRYNDRRNKTFTYAFQKYTIQQRKRETDINLNKTIVLSSTYPSIDKCSWAFVYQLIDVSGYPSTRRLEFAPSNWIEDTMFFLKCDKTTGTLRVRRHSWSKYIEKCMKMITGDWIRFRKWAGNKAKILMKNRRQFGVFPQLHGEQHSENVFQDKNISNHVLTTLLLW